MLTREKQNSSVAGSNSEAPQGAGLSQSEEMDARAAARSYIENGFKVIPIPRGRKAPNLRGWSDLDLEAIEVERYFGPSDNIGILLGEPSGWLVDVDLDSPEARELADDYLPTTGMEHGRKSSPRSHRWYLTGHDLGPKKFQGFVSGVDRSCLLEIRSTGQQTIVPPSIHPTGEAFCWSSDAVEPPRIVQPRSPAGDVVWRSRVGDTIVWKYWDNDWRIQTGSRRVAGRLRDLSRIERVAWAVAGGFLEVFELDTRKLDSLTVRRIFADAERVQFCDASPLEHTSCSP